MSSLGNLFGGGGADSNDALRYSAPKEPKKKSAVTFNKQVDQEQKPSPVSAGPAPLQPAAPPVSQSSEKTPGPSKILSSATVRLYKVNPATNAYQPIEGGALLGCVIVGTAVNYQILIYNAQKAPQAAVLLTYSFDYSIRDLYMSFADTSGNFWSILFDSFDVMTNMLRTIGAVLIHCATHNESTLDHIRRSMPSNSDATGDDTTLSAGMTAGIYITAWEIGQIYDYPSDILAQAPTKAVKPPSDVIKVKIGSEEVIGGLGNSLIGLKKGEKCTIGISPKIFYNNSTGELITAADRVNPGNWMLLEVEVAKIKSSEKEKKKEKKVASPDLAVVPYSSPDPVESNNDVTSRMAKLAAQSGGGRQLADIVNGKKSSIDESARVSDNADQRRPFKDNESHLSQSKYEESRPVVNLNQQTVQSQQPIQVQQQTQSSSVAHDAMTQQYMTQFQQSMMILQQSIMQMHTKLDHVGMQVSSSNTILQQQQQQNQMMNMNGVQGMQNGMNMGMMGGMNGMGNMGMNGGMGNMGMNGGMNSMGMSMGGFGNQMGSPYQQQYPQQGFGMQQSQGFNNMNGGMQVSMSGMHAGNPMRMKADELITNAQYIVQQYEQMKAMNQELQSGQQTRQSGDNELIAQLRAKLTFFEGNSKELQDKNANLSEEINKIQTEKYKILAEAEYAKAQVNLDSPQVAAFVTDKLKRQQDEYDAKILELGRKLEEADASFKDEKARAEALADAVKTLETRLTDATNALVSKEKELETAAKNEKDSSKELETAEKIVLLEDNNHRIEEEKAALQGKISELEAQLAQRPASTPVEAATKSEQLAEEDVKAIVQEVYTRAADSFITPEELESIEDDAKRETMAQVTKLHLKRLKEILKQITASRLS